MSYESAEVSRVTLFRESLVDNTIEVIFILTYAFFLFGLLYIRVDFEP
jgi:hypothetical protein